MTVCTKIGEKFVCLGPTLKINLNPSFNATDSKITVKIHQLVETFYIIFTCKMMQVNCRLIVKFDTFRPKMSKQLTLFNAHVVLMDLFYSFFSISNLFVKYF